MKRSHLRRALALLLLLALTACGTTPPPAETTAPPTETAPPAQTTFALDARYVILRSEESTEAVKAAQYIVAAITAVCGETPTLATDWVKPGKPVVEGEYEILVGPTNRSASVEALATLKRRDWCYAAPREGQIVVCGRDGESTLEAARAFCADLLGYSGEESATAQGEVQIPIGATRTYAHQYAVSSITLGGRPITDYTLVVPNTGARYLDAVTRFNDLLSADSGIMLPYVRDDRAGDGPKIRLGRANSAASDYTYTVSAEGEDLVFDAGQKSLLNAVERYLTDPLSPGVGALALDLPETPLQGYGGEINGLVLDRETTETCASGITYSRRHYRDRDGKPVTADVLTVEPGAAKFVNGTPNGGTALHNVRATTVEAAKAAAGQGYRVIAGVNADFFRINEDYSPRGVCIKQGETLSTSTRPFFAVTADGKPVIDIGDNLSQYDGTLAEAVGGSDIILRNGEIDDVGYGTEFGYTRHPRTAVGFDGTGRIFLVVVDGRQPSLSNGASLGDLAILFLELGATDALNLDGGGSSTFILADGAQFRTKNSPSDGSLRKVYNSLLVVGN